MIFAAEFVILYFMEYIVIYSLEFIFYLVNYLRSYPIISAYHLRSYPIISAGPAFSTKFKQEIKDLKLHSHSSYAGSETNYDTEIEEDKAIPISRFKDAKQKGLEWLGQTGVTKESSGSLSIEKFDVVASNAKKEVLGERRIMMAPHPSFSIFGNPGANTFTSVNIPDGYHREVVMYKKGQILAEIVY